MDNKKTESPAEIVREFYDTYGWKTDGDSGTLLAETCHQDLNDPDERYRFGHELRYQKYFKSGGENFMDADCGAMPRPEMAEGFQNHICFDISITGLKEAKRKLGDSGIYILGDLSALPFKDGTLDGVLASHCLYHVDKDLQVPVLREFHSVAKPTKNVLVFYSSHHNLVSLIHWVPKVAIPLFNRILKPLRLYLGTAPPYLMTIAKRDSLDSSDIPGLYSHPQNPRRIASEFQSADVTCLMSLTMYDTQLLRKLPFLKPIIPIINFFETRFPHLMTYFGKYVCIRIQKN